MNDEPSIKKKKKSKKRKHDQIEQETSETSKIDDENNENDSVLDEDKEIDQNESDKDEFATYQKSTANVLEPYSCVEHLHKEIKFPLLPIAINQELKVIRQTLIHKWKYHFINELNGFLNYFDNLEVVQDNNGKMMDDLPFIYYHITADFYVFRPKEGEYLKAKISCFEDSNKVINCSTDYELTIFIQLPEEISDKLNRYLKLHQEIIFLIKTIDYSKMAIEGTIDKRCLKLMEKHVEIVSTVDEIEQNNQNESNLDDFFAD